MEGLTCPQLLSKETLYEILKNRCIEIANFESMDKEQLLEIFKRVAFPLPQRKYGKQHLHRKMHNLRVIRNISEVDYDHVNNGMDAESNNLKSKRSIGNDNENGKLMKTFHDVGPSEKISGKCDNNNLKRKPFDLNSVDCQKRQKISWP